jgi:outer membrane receptor protein involved in Fe transport
MSITAATGDQLVKLGVTDASQLAKLVPGFTFNETAYGVPVFTIRGIGFQETSLGASPAVSVYIDEVPIPFSAEAVGAGLDIERLEVLKGPQGTLFGSNSTGGALNYIAAKPGKEPHAGFDASLGRFATVDVQGYSSVPLTETLGVRLSARLVRSDDYQQSTTRDETLGQRNILQARMLLAWRPSERWRTTLNLTAIRDRSDTPAPQFRGFAALNAGPTIPAEFVTHPPAPDDNRKTDWDPGRDWARNNRFLFGSFRNEFDLTDNVRMTLLTSLQQFKRFQPVEGDGTRFVNYRALSRGKINTFFQEARLDGTIGDALTYIIGANYEYDRIYDSTVQTYAQSSSASVFGIPLGPTMPNTLQKVRTYGVYANADYEVSDQIVLHGGIRFTQSNRRLVYGCGQDIDGSWAEVSEEIQRYLNTLAGKGPVFTEVPLGGCGTTDQFTNEPAPGRGELNQNNISWRAGVDFKPSRDLLLYLNVSRGYKAGSFPTLAASSNRQFLPVVQESVLAYEGGIKATLAQGAVQANAAVFYYDYTNKQILGRIPDLAFGPLPALVNVPTSRVWGAELDVVIRPVEGLRIRPAATYVNSRLGDGFENYNSFGQLLGFGGEAFPYTPEWQANVDAEYEAPLTDTINGFVGGTMVYQAKSNGAFGEYPEFVIDAYTTFDARLGISSGDDSWRLQVWARNLTDKYYWTAAYRSNDSINRFSGQPRTFGVTLSHRY